MLLFDPLSPEEMARQADAIMSPPLWDLGHIAAYEELWLVRRLSGGPSLHPDLQDVYDAVYEMPPLRRRPTTRNHVDRVDRHSIDEPESRSQAENASSILVVRSTAEP